MKRCSPEAWARCPDAKTCERFAEFGDGSECDQFNLKTMAEIDEGRAQPELLPVLAGWRNPKNDPPEDFVSVLGYMEDADPFPPVRECYNVGGAFFFPALGEVHPVKYWAEMPQPDAAQQPFVWVPVKKRLPETEPKTVTWSGDETMQIELSEPVLVADGKGRKYVARYENGPAFQGWTEEESQITLHDVAFWAEIPEPLEV